MDEIKSINTKEWLESTLGRENGEEKKIKQNNIRIILK